MNHDFTLLHAFPGFLGSSRNQKQSLRRLVENDEAAKEYGDFGIDILKNILKNGLLLTPESIDIPYNPTTHSSSKKKALKQDPNAADSIEQIRACFTLSNIPKLTQHRELEAKTTVSELPETDLEHFQRHADLFGLFAICIDPMIGRNLGIIPVNYFYRNNTSGQLLGPELLYRLMEIRNIVAILCFMESQTSRDVRYRDHFLQILDSVGHDLRHDESCINKIKSASVSQLEYFLACIDTDRVSLVDLLDQVDIFLMLFQTTDSKDASPLAYYRQLEWRLAFYRTREKSQPFLRLGDDSVPNSIDELNSIAETRKLIDKISTRKGRPSGENEVKKSALFRYHQGKKFRSFITTIVIPAFAMTRVIDEISKFASEDFDPKIVTSQLNSSGNIVNIKQNGTLSEIAI